jgi:tetratricopeptide (TPR) repeat protein
MQKALLSFLIWPLWLWLSICVLVQADTDQAVLKSEFGKGTSVLEQRLFADAADGRLDEFTLLDAALIASGVKDSAELVRYRKRMAAWAEELKQSGSAGGSPRQRVEVIFAFLHGKILKGKYNLQCTDLRQAIDEGRFNCVSATVLFNCLAGKLGFSCRALETPGHTLSRVFLADGPLDVETTCPQWFCLQHDTQTRRVTLSGQESCDSPQNMPQKTVADRKGTASSSFFEKRDSPQRENQDGLQKTIGQKPDANKVKLREISPIQLTAMIYYNRGIDFLAEKHFADAAAANAKAIRLDPQSGTAWGNFLATINNWAIDLGNVGDYARAADLLRQGLELDPHYEAFTLNFAHVYHQWSQDLCKEGKYSAAVELLNRAAAEMPDNAYFQRAKLDVCRRWALALLESNKMDEAFDILKFMN